MNLEELKFEQKLADFRKKWLQAKQKGDLTMCSVIERQVKALKLSYKKTAS